MRHLMFLLALVLPGYSGTNESEIIQKTRDWWAAYQSNLADYVCEQRSSWHQFTSFSRARSKLDALEALAVGAREPWRVPLGLVGVPDTVTTVQIIGGKEQHEFKTGERLRASHQEGAVNAGVAAIMAADQTKLHYLGDGWLREIPVRILSTETENLLTYSSPSRNRKRMVKGPTVGFRGKLYVERESGKVLRYLAEHPIKPPPPKWMRDVGFIVEYDDVEISGSDGATEFLPVGQFSYFVRSDRSRVGEISKIGNCRKFGSDVKLTFEE